MDIHLIQLHGCKHTHISRRPQGVYQNNYFKDNEFILSEKKKKKNPFPRVSFCSTHCEPALILLVSSVTTLSLKDQTLVRICFICLEGEQWLIVHSHVLAQETVSGTAPFVICIYPKWSLSLVQVISRGMNKNLSALLHHRPRNS